MIIAIKVCQYCQRFLGHEEWPDYEQEGPQPRACISHGLCKVCQQAVYAENNLEDAQEAVPQGKGIWKQRGNWRVRVWACADCKTEPADGLFDGAHLCVMCHAERKACLQQSST